MKVWTCVVLRASDIEIKQKVIYIVATTRIPQTEVNKIKKVLL
jgi:hypothetical protein